MDTAPSRVRIDIIHLVPVGDCAGVDSAALVAFVAAWFGLPVVRGDQVPLSALRRPGVRRNELGGEQVQTKSITDHLALHCKPFGVICTVGFTMLDLYPDPSWSFAFGVANPASGVGVFSFARYLSGDSMGGRPLLCRIHHLPTSIMNS